MEKDSVLVFSTDKQLDIEIASEILSDNDIQFNLLDRRDSSFPTVGDIEIYVHENDLELALDVLKKLKN